jgi:hypothetical protein
VQGDVDLPFSLIWVTKTNAVEGRSIPAMWLYQECNQSIPMTGMAVTTLSGSIQHKTGVATDCLCQIALNQKLLGNFESGVNFQVALE